MRAGCLNLVLRVGVAAIAAILTVLGTLLLFSVAVSLPGEPLDFERVFKVAAAAVAGYCFYLVGRSVWRDIKERRPPQDRGPTKDGP